MKKQISFIAALTMLITTLFSNGVFAAFDDVDDTNPYKNSIITLSKLGVIDGYDDGSFKPDNEITRAEFTKMLISAMGFGDHTTEPTEFDDLSDHWARCFIKTAYDMGIVNGTGERTFEPDKAVTYEQAVKMMVCAVGYDSYAQSRGGYPSGYMNVAESLFMTKGISGQANSEPASRQVIAQLVYNSLEVDMLEQSNINQYEKSGKTLMKDYLNVVKLRGSLVGVEDTLTNDCTVALNKNQIAVKTYSTGAIVIISVKNFDDLSIGELSKLLGNEMTFYYEQGDLDAEKDLKIIDNETIQNTTYTINFKDFINYSGSSFKYYEGKNSKTIKVDSAATVIYNGQSLDPNSFTTDIEPRDTSISTDKYTGIGISEALGLWLGSNTNYSIRGDVMFTDAGNDGTMDIITINDYKSMLAYKSLSVSDYILQNRMKTGDSINLDPNAIGKKVYVEKDGKEILPSAIRANDIVSYTISPDGTIINAYVITKTVKGTVTSMDRTNNIILIDSVEYYIDSGCEAYILEKEGRALDVGTSGTFYLDKMGYIVYGTLESVTANPYAYIANVTEDYIEDAAYITLYIPSVSTRDTVTYKLADKARINNTTMKSYAEAVTALAEIAKSTNDDVTTTGVYASGTAQSTTYSQPVRVKVDSAAKTISAINVVDVSNTDKNEDPSKLARYRTLKRYYYTGSSFKTSSTSKVEFTINSSKTTVLYIPRDRSNKTGYSKKTTSNAFTSGNYYWVEAYDVNNSNVASLVILYGDSGQLNEVKKTTDFSLVAKVPDKIYDESEGMTVDKLSLFTGASTTIGEWTALKSGEFSDVVPGDVIQFAYDDDKKIQKRLDILKYSDISSVLNDTAGRNVEYTLTDEDGSEHTETRTEIYNWNEEIDQVNDPNYQLYKFDYRFANVSQCKTLINAINNASSEEVRNEKIEELKSKYYTQENTTTLGYQPYSRACVYNVYQVQSDINRLYLTKEGFDPSTNELRPSSDIVYDEVISSSAKILRMEYVQNTTSFSPYAVDSETPLTIEDLKDAEHYGSSCSKVIVFSRLGTARLIVILP